MNGLPYMITYIKERGRYMTALRQSAIAELERVPEDKLTTIIQFINNLMGETEPEERGWDLEQFIMPPTERGGIECLRRKRRR